MVDIARNGIDRVNNLEKEVERLRARVAELEAQERGGWIRTSGWSNELYSFDRSDNMVGNIPTGAPNWPNE